MTKQEAINLESEVTMEIRNAKITDTFLGHDYHDSMKFMTFVIWVKMDDGHTGLIGLYELDQYNFITEKAENFSPKVLEAIRRILDIAGVNEWKKLNGSFICVEDKGFGKRMTKIGNLMKDRWFDMEEFFRGN